MTLTTKKIVLACFLLLWQSLALADAEVTRNGDGNWWSRVDGATVYQGDRFFDAVNAAANSMGEGTINIRNSGGSGPDTGQLHAIRPRPNQTLDFHGHRIMAEGGEVVVPIYCDRRDNITVRNVHVTGNPRYGMWFRGCSDVVLNGVTMDLSPHSEVGLGIRVDDSTGPASNLTVQGNIHINGATAHALETYGVDGFSIGDVTVTNSGGAGLLLNNSRNGTVGQVVGSNNNHGGGYATFRVANGNGPNVHVQSVYSRDSGRGFFSVSGSHGTTIEHVDIEGSSSHGIFLEDATDTHVLAGRVAGGHPNCQLVRTDDSSISVDGCEQVGTPPGGSDNSIIEGRYRIVPVHSDKTLDLDGCGTANGTNIHQWAWTGHECQTFNISPVDGEWHRIAPPRSPGKALDVAARSTDDGANVQIWDYWGGANQQFRFQKAGSAQWRIVNRHSGLCLDIAGQSTSHGANLVQWECTPFSDNQQFRLIRQ